jgi:hypothetical protein
VTEMVFVEVTFFVLVTFLTTTFVFLTVLNTVTVGNLWAPLDHRDRRNVEVSLADSRHQCLLD